MSETWDDVDLTTPPDDWSTVDLTAEPLAVTPEVAAVGFPDDDVVSLGPQDPAPERLPAVLAADVGVAVRDWTDPDQVGKYASALRSAVLAGVQETHAELAAKRPEGKRLTSAVAAPELVFLGQASATLDAVAGAIAAGAKEARDIAGEVLVDLNGGDDAVRIGTRSTKVSDQHGGMKVTRTQSSKTVAQADEIVDVLVAALVAQQPEGSEPIAVGGVARGAREMAEQLLALMGPPSWKSTALDALVQRLEQSGEDALAIRLSVAHGKKPTGNPRTTIERTEAKE